MLMPNEKLTRRKLIAMPVAAGMASSLAVAMNTPQPAPPLAFRLADQKTTIDLSNYRGKVVVLEFLLTTCPHCQRCSSIMQKLYQEFGPKDVQMLGCAVNDMSHMLIAEYSQKLNLTYPVGYATRELSQTTLPLANATLKDLQRTSAALRALTERIEADGATSLIGGSKLPDYEP